MSVAYSKAKYGTFVIVGILLSIMAGLWPECSHAQRQNAVPGSMPQPLRYSQGNLKVLLLPGKAEVMAINLFARHGADGLLPNERTLAADAALKCGAAGLPADSLDPRMQLLACQINSVNLQDGITVKIRALYDRWPESLQLALLLLTQPRFEGPACKQLGLDWLGAWRDAQLKPASQLARMAGTEVFAQHPYSANPMEPMGPGGLTPDSLRAWHRRWLAAAQWTVVVSGFADTTSLKRLLQPLASLAQPPAAKGIPLFRISGRKASMQSSIGMQYTYTRCYFAMPTIQTSDWAVASTALALLSQQLHTELVELKHLAADFRVVTVPALAPFGYLEYSSTAPRLVVKHIRQKLESITKTHVAQALVDRAHAQAKAENWMKLRSPDDLTDWATTAWLAGRPLGLERLLTQTAPNAKDTERWLGSLARNLHWVYYGSLTKVSRTEFVD